MGTLAQLQADVARETAVDASVLALVKGLADQLAAAGTDSAALDALHSQMVANADALAAAVAANTAPVAPAPPPDPAAPAPGG